jgi:hypothetical protein
MGISAPFLSTPFYQGSQVAADTPYYLPVSIGARSYLLDLKKYQRRTIPPIRPPQDSSEEPGEQSLSQEGLWRRSQQSWHLGAGQEFFDDPDSAKPRARFWTSKGLNPWTKKHLTLLNDTQAKRSSANTNLRVLLVGTRLYVVDGSSIYFIATPADAAWTVAGNLIDSTAGGSAVASITTDGAKVWAAVGTTGIRETVAGTTSATTLIAGTYTLVGYVNGRLLAANGNVLFEITRAGSATTIWTHPNPNFLWTVIAAAPNAAYLGGISADRTDIYSITTLDATGALAPPVLAASLPDGETLNSIEHYAGILLLATSRGLRLAGVGSNNTLQFGTVVEIPNGVRATEGQGEFVWFSWSNYDSLSTGLGRANLATFTDELVPAYASDLMATTQGTVTSIASFGGRRYFAVSGAGFYGETTTLVASGTFNTGKIRYGTTEKKAATSLDLRHSALPSGSNIGATIIDELGDETLVGFSDLAGSLSPTGPLSMSIQRSEAIQVELTLNRAAVLGPDLNRWTLYSRVTPVLNDEIIAPLIIHEYVLSEAGEGSRIAYEPLKEYQFLKNLVDTKELQLYQEGSLSWLVYLSELEVQPVDWAADNSFFNGTILVRMITVSVV